MKLVQFSTTNGLVWVNPDHVVVVEGVVSERSRITTVACGKYGTSEYVVNDTVEHVASRLQGDGDV